jgi:hypothetical protein
MGFKFYDLPGSSERYYENIDYLTLSILPRYNLNQTGFYFFTGSSFGYLFHANSAGGGKSISSTEGYYKFDLFGIVGEEYCGSAYNYGFSFTLAYKFGNSGQQKAW